MYNGTASNCHTTAAPTALCCSAFGPSTATARTEHRVHEFASAAAQLLWAAQHGGVVAAAATRFTSWRLQCRCAPRGDRARPIAAWGGERRHGRRCCRYRLCVICKCVRLTTWPISPEKPNRTSNRGKALVVPLEYRDRDARARYHVNISRLRSSLCLLSQQLNTLCSPLCLQCRHLSVHTGDTPSLSPTAPTCAVSVTRTAELMSCVCTSPRASVRRYHTAVCKSPLCHLSTSVDPHVSQQVVQLQGASLLRKVLSSSSTCVCQVNQRPGCC